MKLFALKKMEYNCYLTIKKDYVSFTFCTIIYNMYID